jgi:hypothetical protein
MKFIIKAINLLIRVLTPTRGGGSEDPGGGKVTKFLVGVKDLMSRRR